jgi:hypothetical protein
MKNNASSIQENLFEGNIILGKSQLIIRLFYQVRTEIFASRCVAKKFAVTLCQSAAKSVNGTMLEPGT